MTEEKTKVDVRKTWTHKGRKCVILWVINHYCAYVETKIDTSYTQEFGSYETSPESNIEAHGGLTFSGKLEELEDGLFYFGCFTNEHHKNKIEKKEKK